MALVASIQRWQRESSGPVPQSANSVAVLSPAEQKQTAEEAAKRARLRAEEVVRGKRPTTTNGKGITMAANGYLVATLRDPDSLDVVRCSEVGTYGADCWAQRVTYRARNGFGGMETATQTFVIKDGAVILAITG